MKDNVGFHGPLVLSNARSFSYSIPSLMRGLCEYWCVAVLDRYATLSARMAGCERTVEPSILTYCATGCHLENQPRHLEAAYGHEEGIAELFSRRR